MDEMIKRLEQRKADLTARAEQSTDVDELRRIHQQLVTINEDLAALIDAQAKVTTEDEEVDERTAAVNSVKESRSDAPKFIQGKGFIPAEERGNKNLDSVLEQREKAGTSLKENRAVKSPLSTFGELRAVTTLESAKKALDNARSQSLDNDKARELEILRLKNRILGGI